MYKALLCHHPEYYAKLQPYGINLILSGHVNTASIPRFGNETEVVVMRVDDLTE